MPRELVDLLWRDHPAAPRGGTRGPRSRVTTGAVVEAASALADAEGLPAVTVRRLGETLGISTMSVYTHVNSRDDLLVLMADAAWAAMPLPDHTGGWRACVRRVAEANLALLVEHPWLLEIDDDRTAFGPGTIAKYDHELGAFEGTGLGDVERDAALTFVLGFVEACAHAAARARAAEHDSRLSDAQWWEAHAPELARVFDPARYPLATRVGAAAGEYHQAAFAPEFGYRFGLARVLDGLEALIEQTRARSRRT